MAGLLPIPLERNDCRRENASAFLAKELTNIFLTTIPSAG
jgi:hypothetical protein